MLKASTPSLEKFMKPYLSTDELADLIYKVKNYNVGDDNEDTL